MPAAEATASISLKTVLVATDFSPCSNLALQFGHAIARQLQGKLFLAHILGSGAAYPNVKLSLAELAGEENDIRKRMDRLLVTKGLTGIFYESLASRGELCPALNEIIHQHGIELVVVGTRGREALSKLLFGSGAEQVFRHARCPVITVGPHVTTDCLDQGCFKRVVCAVDFSASSLNALPYAIALGKQNLTLLRVLYRDMAAAEFGSTVFDNQEFYDTREKLRGLIPPGVAAHATIELGIPADTIVRTAREQNAGLIVMGVNAKSALAATHLPWATAHRVICDSPCPVLTVR